MASSAWVPHGYIINRSLEEPFNKAHKSIDQQGNSKDPKEHFTIRLWENIFNKVVFVTDFFVNSQQPPSEKPGPDTACDIVISYVDWEYHHHILCFAEAKRTRNVTASKIRDLETQARGYCLEFLDADENVDSSFVYVCTLVELFIRCWRVARSDGRLVGFWNGSDKGEFCWYLDVGLDDNKRWLDYAFGQMKAFPPSALRLGQEVSTIGSARGAQSFSSFQAPVSSSEYLPDPPTIPSWADFLAKEAFEVTVETASDTHYDCRLPNDEEKNLKTDGWYGATVDVDGQVT